jgi:hypothetical protein
VKLHTVALRVPRSLMQGDATQAMSTYRRGAATPQTAPRHRNPTGARGLRTTFSSPVADDGFGIDSSARLEFASQDPCTRPRVVSPRAARSLRGESRLHPPSSRRGFRGSRERLVLGGGFQHSRYPLAVMTSFAGQRGTRGGRRLPTVPGTGQLRDSFPFSSLPVNRFRCPRRRARGWFLVDRNYAYEIRIPDHSEAKCLYLPSPAKFGRNPREKSRHRPQMPPLTYWRSNIDAETIGR